MLAFAALLVIGCGNYTIAGGSGNGNGSASTPQQFVETHASIVAPKNGKEFNLTVQFVKKLSANYTIRLDRFRVTSIGGCVISDIKLPQAVTLNGSAGSSKEVFITGTFANAGCDATRYKFSYVQTVNDGIQTQSKTIYYDSAPTTGNANAPKPKPKSSFFNATSPLIITKSDTSYKIKVQLLKDGYAQSDQTVRVKAFDSRYGIISNPTTKTGQDGFAVFDYTSPKQLPDGESVTIVLTHDDNGTVISQNVILKFSVISTGNIGATDINTTLPTVVVPTQLRKIVLDSNSKTVDIPIKVFKDIAPYTQGSVRVELPQKVLNGTDVGQFDSYEVKVNAQGIALFRYTGPSNLQALLDNNDTGSIFKFYHVDNSADKQSVKVEYRVPPNPHVTRNYTLRVVTSGNFSMGIPNKEKSFNILLEAKDSAGNSVPLSTERITAITVKTTNATIAQFLDTASNSLVDRLNLNPVNNSSFILRSKTLSGLVPIEVTIGFDDINGVSQTLSTIVNVRVYSGPPTAISISYVKTMQDVNRSKYIDVLAISVTDSYGNKVNTRPNVTVGAIAGYAVDGREVSGKETNTTHRLFFGKKEIDNGIANGVISSPNGAHKATFTDPLQADVFRYVNAEGNNTDKLVVFGARKNYEAMGKWDINRTGANNTLDLIDDYFGVSRSGLYYAVGHNYYQDQCRPDGREWIGYTDSDSYRLDDQGTVIVKYIYDYHLTGKDVTIWVNLDGFQPDTGKKIRVGEAVKHTLRGYGFTKAPSAGYKVAKGTTAYATFVIWHKNAPERYRNGHFGHAVKSGSNCFAVEVASSNNFDARTCDNRVTIGTKTFGSTDGTAYVTYFLSAPIDKDCTFDITSILVAPEF